MFAKGNINIFCFKKIKKLLVMLVYCHHWLKVINWNYLYVIVHQHHQIVVEMNDDDDGYAYDDDEDLHVLFVQLLEKLMV